MVASWANPAHTVGTIEGFEGLGSREKWLRVHNTFEWPDFYAYQDDLRRFFDRYLRGLENGWENTPSVRCRSRLSLDLSGFPNRESNPLAVRRIPFAYTLAKRHQENQTKGVNMVIGIGTDILKMSGLNPLWLQSEGAFITRTYTQAEIETAGERPDQHTYYAMRFSGKEAVFKALGLSADKVRFNEIEILSDEYGRPYVKLLGRTGCEAAQKCIADVQISLSYDGGFALAYAMAQTE